MPLPYEHRCLELSACKSFAAFRKHFNPGKFDPIIDRVQLGALLIAVDVNARALPRVFDEVEGFEPVQSVAHSSHQGVVDISFY